MNEKFYSKFNVFKKKPKKFFFKRFFIKQKTSNKNKNKQIK